MKVEVDKIKLIQDFYPRHEMDSETVNGYRLNIDKLPPIILTKDLTLVDGYHRVVAYRIEQRTEIEVEEPLLDITGREIFVEAIRRNAFHGKPLTSDERRAAAIALCQNGKEPAEVATLIGRSVRTVNDWTADIRKEKKQERDTKILELYLACYTQEEIAEKVGLERSAVSKILDSVKNGKIAETHIPESLRLYNVWNFPKCDSRYGLNYPGRIPGQIIENLLHYYTKPFDLVVDPMMGGGTTVDVCKVFYRRYRAYDINPVREDIRVEKHDIRKGYPPEVQKVALVFLDPPYWRLQREGYTQDGVAATNYEEWLTFMRKLAVDTYEVLKENGHVGLLVEAFLDEKVTGRFLDLPFECCQSFMDAGFAEVQRVSAPMPSDIKQGHDVEYAKKNGMMLDLNRDLLIFRRA